MTESEAMELAIAEARKCEWSEEELDVKPKVGAVITIVDERTAAGHGGRDDPGAKNLGQPGPCGHDGDAHSPRS